MRDPTAENWIETTHKHTHSIVCMVWKNVRKTKCAIITKVNVVSNSQLIAPNCFHLYLINHNIYTGYWIETSSGEWIKSATPANIRLQMTMISAVIYVLKWIWIKMRCNFSILSKWYDSMFHKHYHFLCKWQTVPSNDHLSVWVSRIQANTHTVCVIFRVQIETLHCRSLVARW